MAAAVASASLPGDRPFDGVNLLPFVTGRNAAHPHEYLYWRFGKQWAVRSKEWKLVCGEEAEQLYDLGTDASESRDAIAEQPEAAKELREAYAQWDANLVAPLWVGNRANQPAGKRAS